MGKLAILELLLDKPSNKQRATGGVVDSGEYSQI